MNWIVLWIVASRLISEKQMGSIWSCNKPETPEPTVDEIVYPVLRVRLDTRRIVALSATEWQPRGPK
jgi:hypothetical protein